MKTVIIFDHPYTASAYQNIPHHRSFLAALSNKLILQLKEQGQTVDLIDLHADNFNPVMTAEELSKWRQGKSVNEQAADYQKRLLEADQIVFMFPVWWEVMPAMTKGFLDKVYSKGQMYKANNMKTTLVKKPKIRIITTMSTPKIAYHLIIGSLLIKALKRGTFMKTQLMNVKWQNFSRVEKLSEDKRKQVLDNFRLK